MSWQKRFAGWLSQMAVPITALAVLLLFNLIRDPAFFRISMRVNNNGNSVLSGNIISIIDSASELAIIAMGMTLVTAACGGQDISVGCVGAISGAVFIEALLHWFNVDITVLSNGIYTAMITTVAGLVVGIVAYFAYNYLVSKLDSVVQKMELKTMEFMDLLNEPLQ